MDDQEIVLTEKEVEYAKQYYDAIEKITEKLLSKALITEYKNKSDEFKRGFTAGIREMRDGFALYLISESIVRTR